MELITTFALVMIMLHFFVADTEAVVSNSNGRMRTGPMTFKHMAPFAAGMAVTVLTLLGAQVSRAQTRGWWFFLCSFFASVFRYIKNEEKIIVHILYFN